MLRIKGWHDLPEGKGRVAINFDGTVIIQAGGNEYHAHPNDLAFDQSGVIKDVKGQNPLILEQDDLKTIQNAIVDFKKNGGKVFGKGVIRPR